MLLLTQLIMEGYLIGKIYRGKIKSRSWKYIFLKSGT